MFFTFNIMIIPGSGRQCKFWSTPWSPFGQLITFLGNTGPRAIGIPLSTSLGSLWNGKSWTLPPARSNIMKLVMTFLITISLTHTPDAAIWNTTGFDPFQNQKFSARKVYNLIRESKPIVPWKNTVWLKKGIPKFKTLTWLFVLDRCPTRNILISWGLQTDGTCLLCNQEP